MLGDSSAVLGGGGGGDAVATVASAAASGVPAGTSRDGAESVAAAAGSNSGEDIDRGKGEEGDRSFGGNRWPRQETLALLKIRQDMDVAFRDASVKGPLWEDVSRKLAELGYHRSAKKCKEKFENVYKYHKRTKEGRSGKSEGKTYRFFDQIEALENHPPTQQSKPQQPPALPPSKPQLAAAIPATPVSVVTSTSPIPMPPPPPHVPPTLPHVTVPSTITLPTINLTVPPYNNPTNIPSFFSSDPMFSNSSSSSTSSDETTLERQRKRKRKWKDFFERLMKEVIEKQEELQKRFLEAIEKREHERMVREEAWRMQEMARITREREILAQERSIAAAKDAAVMAFLQKIAEQQNLNIPQPQPQPTAPPPPPPPPAPPQPQAAIPQQQVTNMEITENENNNNNNNNMMGQSSSRWPKVEVQALIKLRTSMDAKYQENGPKGPLWEEISAAMRKLGYNRNSKRCKEKWENINKYFKKVKESNKRRPEDSKTCPYFHQLDALYREKNSNKVEDISVGNHNNNMNMAPLMVRPEQQWPPQQDTRMEEAENEPVMEDEEDDEDKDMGEEEEEEDEEEEGGGNYEIVASKPASVNAAE